MKKRLFTIIAIMLCAVMFALVGCDNKQPTGDEPPSTAAALRLRSDPEQALKVGEKMTIVYSKANTDSAVAFSSSDENVVTVDKFAGVTGTGAGTAVVTLYLEDDPTVKAEVTFTVTRNNFMRDNGYYTSGINFGQQELGGDVTILGGQVQLLANAAGQTWYFKTHIDHTGVAGGDSYGTWGVGSFLVNSANPIGHTMFWYMLRRTEEQRKVTASYGGWRYDTTVTTHKETDINDVVYNAEKGVDFTIIRKGVTHYVIAEFGSGEEYQSFKYTYDVPLFDSLDTFPGVFSQNQMLTVSNYSMSNDPDEVMKILENFQLAEEIEINGFTDTLAPGAYDLTSTVRPVFTINKAATYALETATDGVTLTPSGALTITDAALGKTFTVVATAVSDPETTCTRTYTVAEKPASTSDLVDTGAAIKGGSITPQASGVNVANNDGATYIPLNTVARDKWMMTVDIENRKSGQQVAGTEIGIMTATNGFMNYGKLGIEYTYSKNSNIAFSGLDGAVAEFPQAAIGGLTANAVNSLGLVKDGNTYYVIINGKFTKKVYHAIGDAMPVLYSIGAGVYFRNVSLVTDVGEIAAYIASKPYYVGSYVTVVSDTAFTLDALDLGEAGSAGDTLDWPPDNDYANGIKSATTFTGDYQIEFTLSDVKPYRISNGSYDAKILVYLKSERVTCSLQFVIKRDNDASAVKCSFVPNLDDATWTEYDLPDGVDLMSGETTIKVVRKADRVELYIDGARVYEGEQFLTNTGFWTEETAATPGIGSFMCGAKITNPTFESID